MKFISRSRSSSSGIIIIKRRSPTRTNHRGLLHLSILEIFIILSLVITVLSHADSMRTLSSISGTSGDVAAVIGAINKDDSDNPYENQQYSTSSNISTSQSIPTGKGQTITKWTGALKLTLPKLKWRQQSKYNRDKWLSLIMVNKSDPTNSIVSFPSSTVNPSNRTGMLLSSTELIETSVLEDLKDSHKISKETIIDYDNFSPIIKRDLNSVLENSKNIHNSNNSDSDTSFSIENDRNTMKNNNKSSGVKSITINDIELGTGPKSENSSVISSEVKNIYNNSSSEEMFSSPTPSQQQFDSMWTTTTTIYGTKRVQSSEETTPCNFNEDENCVIDHNVTCVGEPTYCNLTYEEYIQFVFDYIYPTVPEWILIFSHLVVFIMGLVGNALVCIAVYTNYSMRTVTNIFIVNLAVADFFVILFCLPPTVVWDVTETWFMGRTMCKIVLYFQNVSVTVSVLTLTFISIDRWYAICFPLRYRTKISRAIASIAFIWLVALISDIPEFMVLTTKRRELRFGVNLFTQCEATWDLETEKNFYITRFVMLYTLPLLLMTVAYFKIVRVLWKSETIPGHRESRNHQYQCGYSRGTCAPSANTSTMGQLRARRKAAKMLVAVVVMFAGCYFPVNALNILRYTTAIGLDHSDVVTVFALFSHWLCYANSAVNPVIYNFMSGKFRREFRNALDKCRCARKRVEDRSLNHSNPTSRLNNISQSTRSNYQLTSLRDITTRETQRQIAQTTFAGAYGNGHSATPMLNNHVELERVP